MDQIKIGKFIASCRKEKNLTQAQLAEKLGITDRAVSKWETAKSMPDTGLMPELCELLGISVNELISGEKLNLMEDYRKNAESNLLALKEMEESKNRELLKLEWVIGYMGTIPYLILILTASFGNVSTIIRAILIGLAIVLFIPAIYFSLKLERDAGYYECQHCHERYVPTLKQVVFAPHNGRKRYMKCPKCGKRTYQIKVLTK
ncbi:helix-turn-helix domain-containing protein [Lacrimispora sphenoides]|uniref:Transcriptional regulator, contains XRE-family HTH domain n=1 Tax=Lacrimispora sphenoides JCM 1415 TaxID=1297793 RepID=A0ABY1C5D4_9FIRM|nr:helix-turn-helix transcriptional regulator [Lacrimispora sphenoides]SET69185.1 Transcriptional regulator, contains XRE-family HTH domain [[Clostridium] sphenoides JCM 1415]SUY50528.1 putative transcriptional regulator [Lacrimispora sphenoides]